MLVLILLALLAAQAELVDGLESGSLLLDLTQLAAGNATLETTTCVEQLRALHNAWQQGHSWALKAFDASGSGYHNFMLGNSFWLGNRWTCRALNEQLLLEFTQRQEQLLRQGAPFAHDYRAVYLRANSPWQLALAVKEPPLLHIGLCVPRSCDPPQLEQLLRQSLRHLERLELRTELVYTKLPEASGNYFARPAFRWLLLLLAASLLLLLLGRSRWAGTSRFVACFDVANNWRRLWQLPAAGHTTEIAVINGLRVCSAGVLLGVHVVWYQFFSVNHSAQLAAKLTELAYLTAALEVFFVVSGFLTVSNFLRNDALQRSIASDTLGGNVRRFGRQLAQRYLRLAPLQLLVMLLSVLSFGYHREMSVFHLIEPLDELCERHWWRNLLFVQNLYPNKEMCCNWTWSLGCDMQFHIMAMLLLYMHTRYPQLVRRLVLMLLLANVLYTVLLQIVLDVPTTFEALYGIGDWLYTNPLVRMLAYLIGGIYGYAHARGLVEPFVALFPNKLAKCALAGVVVWLASRLQVLQLASPALVGCGYVLLRGGISTATAHLIWCSFRIDGSTRVTRWLVHFLELDWFQRLNRLSYALYLLNPLIILNLYYSLSDAMPADVGLLIYLCVAHLVIVLVFSVPLTLFFELPFHRLSNLLLTSKIANGKES
ncbi:nose resistant to fluoxetine protein 6 [Drosophila novamexicana]|uniref:nose resistant to fluoxetine protein 6 n=1 Tax=Drosophila novamexicana TaxID=47314 RepID=UPI0011E5C1BB|nr:nose resistant to fluoxetine protein 6 [Drosophila novamexicana]